MFSEIRIAKGNDIPMSPARGKGPFITIHFSWKTENYDEVGKVLLLVEDILAPFDVKSHPGKLFILSGDRYEQLYGNELQELRYLITKVDPSGKFKNDFSDKNIFNGGRLI
jgi:xylitol oxidase